MKGNLGRTLKLLRIKGILGRTLKSLRDYTFSFLFEVFKTIKQEEKDERSRAKQEEEKVDTKSWVLYRGMRVFLCCKF
jgi:hypothetical protein